MWMLGSQGLFPDRQGALVERLGLRVVALDSIEFRQVVEAQALPSPLRQAGTKGVRLAAGFFATAFLAAGFTVDALDIALATVTTHFESFIAIFCYL